MRSGPRGDGLVWTPDTILYALELWARRHGRPPSAREWNRAIRAAGYRPRKPGELRRRDHVRLRDEYGRFLSPQGEGA